MHTNTRMCACVYVFRHYIAAAFFSENHKMEWFPKAISWDNKKEKRKKQRLCENRYSNLLCSSWELHLCNRSICYSKENFQSLLISLFPL